MRLALLMVDVQEDFLSRTPLTPDRLRLEARLADLLAAARSRGLPVFHVHTRQAADGHDAMPHWRRSGRSDCQEGSPGALPPPALAPIAGETVVVKRGFNPFHAPELAQRLQALDVQGLLVAGLYTHACVREAVLGAYELGLEVTVVADAVASTEPLHAEITRQYLAQRACRFVPLEQIFTPGLGEAGAEARATRAVAEAVSAGQSWAQQSPSARAALLQTWRDMLLADQAALLALVRQETAKPAAMVAEEFGRAMAHLEGAIALAATAAENLAPQVQVRYRPLGCVAIITPWNNPLAIAIGKLAPALAYGNSVVWKPAPEVAATSVRLLLSLQQAFAAQALPPMPISLLTGGAEVGEALMRTPGVAAVTLTGSMTTGANARAICTARGLPLQAELGGNNAAIVWHGADLAKAAGQLVQSAYAFAGQRCTAIRRLIVAEDLLPDFIQHWQQATQALLAGPDFSPMITPARRQRVGDMLSQGLAQGAQLIMGGLDEAIPGVVDAAWFPPTLVQAGPDNPLFQEESFGPIAVLTPASSWDQALALAEAVPHGLSAVLLGGTSAQQQDFLQRIQAGMVHLAACHPLSAQAPFAGWKASALGPPEHGRWDREFHSRPQTLYGDVVALSALEGVV